MQRRVWVAVGGLLYALLYANRHWLHWPLPSFATSYLADILALPLILSGALWLMRVIYFRNSQFTLPLAWVLASWLGLSLWFELWLPRLRPQSATADLADVLAYALGGLLFWRWLNVSATPEN
jgi:hypothetical protein